MKVGIVVFDKFLTSEVTAPIEIFAKAGKKGSVVVRKKQSRPVEPATELAGRSLQRNR